MNEVDWRDFNWYRSTEPCCVCGSQLAIGTEPRFAYSVCETHSKLSPAEVSHPNTKDNEK